MNNITKHESGGFGNIGADWEHLVVGEKTETPQPASPPAVFGASGTIPKVSAAHGDVGGKGREFFAMQGLVTYDRGGKILLERQVIRFCDVDRSTVNRDLRHSLFCLLMGSTGMRYEPVLAKYSAHDPYLDGHSWWASDSPEGPEGFVGVNFEESKHLRKADFETFWKFGDTEDFPDHFSSMNDLEAVFPKFYVKADIKEIAMANSFTPEDLVADPGFQSSAFLQMFDVETGEPGWYLRLEVCKPLVLGLKNPPRGNYRQDLVAGLWRHYCFHKHIYISGAGIGLPEHHAPDPESIMASQSLDLNSNYAQLLREPQIMRSLLGELMHRELSLHNRTLFFPVGAKVDESVNAIQELLAARARKAISAASGRVTPDYAPMIPKS